MKIAGHRPRLSRGVGAVEGGAIVVGGHKPPIAIPLVRSIVSDTVRGGDNHAPLYQRRRADVSGCANVEEQFAYRPERPMVLRYVATGVDANRREGLRRRAKLLRGCASRGRGSL